MLDCIFGGHLFIFVRLFFDRALLCITLQRSLHQEYTCATHFFETKYSTSGPSQGLKIRGGTHYWLGIMCPHPLVEIGLTDLTKSAPPLRSDSPEPPCFHYGTAVINHIELYKLAVSKQVCAYYVQQLGMHTCTVLHMKNLCSVTSQLANCSIKSIHGPLYR